MTSYPHISEFLKDIEDWDEHRANVYAEEEATGRIDPDDIAYSDDRAVEILHNIAWYMGIGCDDVWTVSLTTQKLEETGVKPFDYVVLAADADEAISKAMKATVEDDSPDDDLEGEVVKVAQYHKGLPTHNGYWNDARGMTL